MAAAYKEAGYIKIDMENTGVENNAVEGIGQITLHSQSQHYYYLILQI